MTWIGKGFEFGKVAGLHSKKMKAKAKQKCNSGRETGRWAGLSDEAVANIRKESISAPYPTQWELGKKYGISQTQVCKILLRQRHK